MDITFLCKKKQKHVKSFRLSLKGPRPSLKFELVTLPKGCLPLEFNRTKKVQISSLHGGVPCASVYSIRNNVSGSVISLSMPCGFKLSCTKTIGNNEA